MSETSTAPGEPGSLQPSQLNRSCESCRSLKVRCLPSPATPNQCQRCAKSRKTCVFVAPQRRRPRKRTDSRVAQLEREMRMMRSLLKGRIREDSEPESSEGSDDSRDESGEREFQENVGTISEDSTTTSKSARYVDHSPDFINTSHPRMHGSGPFSAPPTFSGLHANFSSNPMRPAIDDVIDRGIITLEDAEQLVDFFIHNLSYFFPLVVFPLSTTAAQLRQTKPVLFLSVITATAISVDAGLAGVLNREMVRLYAERFFVEGEKSLELVQAMLLMIIFYHPPESALKLQSYQYTHIASTMALEIGLATNHRVPNPKSDRKNESQDEHLAEQARALLGCYHLSSNVAMRTRRPNLLHFNDWMAECVKQMELSPHQTDQHIAVWFELQRISDEAMSSFGLDDTSTASSLTECRVQAVLRWFDKRMDTWKKNTPTDMLTGGVTRDHRMDLADFFPVPMILEYRSAVLAMYDLGIGEGYRDPHAVKKQFFTLPTLDEENVSAQGAAMSAIRIDMNVKWMHAAQELLDAALTCSAEMMRMMPNIFYVRFVSAMTSLLKIHFSVRTGALGEVVTPQCVNAGYYLDAIGSKLGDASGGGKWVIPTRWYHVVAVRGRDWLERLEKRYAGLAPGEVRLAMNSVSPPTNTEPLSSSAPIQPKQEPPSGAAHLDVVGSSIMDSFSVPHGVSHMPDMNNIRDGYVAMSGTGMWQMNHSHGHDQFFQPIPGDFQSSHPQATPPSPQFGYEPQRLPPQAGGQRRGTGMEVNGWLPDGSVYGMPPLQKF